MAALPVAAASSAGSLGTIAQGLGIVSSLQGILGLGGSDAGATDYEDSIDPEGMKYLLKIALEGNQGLAAVSGYEQQAGLYNSSTNTLLVNDLLARSAGEVAARNTSRNYKGGKDKGLLGSLGGIEGILGGSMGGGIVHSVGHAIKHLF